MFSLFCENENQAKFSVHFKLQVDNLRTKLAKMWPTYFLIVILRNPVCKFGFLFSFLRYSILSTGNANDLLPLVNFICLLQKNKRTCQLSETRFFSQKCQEAIAILINFFHVFLADLDLNLQKHMC